MIGNSSSGIIEAPSFGKPVINIGDRQKGRAKVRIVLLIAAAWRREIQSAIELALTEEFENKAKNSRNPYEKEDTTVSIMGVIKRLSVQQQNKTEKRIL